ncbi:hypothetical protein [Aeromicrobium wangtongii]|uniref:YtxH domain-containing protein n=1 Tax=Aeromicrobium wangtongii TaxID=2969247 RepID=A0ABY5M598_9ACTN|nr:hypothetical protein [Aeromicrobium wangtongii]MCD9198299.1 hypothetical protein [Aeromicrobium wangtongii]UUP12331.1 hypothetical protein NQV15_10740 [Aeromicrobium wangtongii]
MSLIFSHPIKKLTLLAAFGGGYVLGAKAGRERYEKIRETAQQVAEDPRVQQATAQAQEFVRETAEKVKDDPRIKDVAEKVGSVAHQNADKVEEAVDSAKEKVDTAKHAATDSDSGSDSTADSGSSFGAQSSAPVPTPPSPTATTDSSDVNPLLADEHIDLEETVVYSTGPDIDESVEELTGDEPHRQ